MKLIINNENGIVSGAHCKFGEYAFSLYIDTVERWRAPDGTIYSPAYGDKGSEQERYYCADPDSDDVDGDSVILRAETPEDEEILKRLEFRLQDKDQLWFLFPKEEVWE